MSKSQNYTIWIEAEQWSEDQWNYDDSNTDVLVIWEDKSRWVASFFSYKNIQTLTEKNRKTGECQGGSYFWSSNMILIENTSRKHIEDVVAGLIQKDQFEGIFLLQPLDDYDVL